MIDAPEREAEATGEKYVCPECGKEYAYPQGLKRHQDTAHGGAAASSSAATTRTRAKKTASGPEVERLLGEHTEKLEKNTATVGVALAMFMGLHHTGLTVATRAPISSKIVMSYARKNARLLEAVIRFNGLFEGGETATLLASYAAAGAIDVGVIDPHLQIAVGPVTIGPEMLIGDVIAQVEEARAEQEAQAAAASPNGKARPEETVVEGGVEAT